ncbi:MAG: hypothetical protein JNG84_12550 [Archangium sp.]|nr:hypothetical protein [Archangium sp.]
MKLTLVWALVAASLFAGCGPTKMLVGDGFVGPRGEKTILLPVGGDKKQALYNYILRICDIDNNGVESNCKDTTVLANVMPQSIY